MAKRNFGINIFRQVPKANLPRTRFNMSHNVKFSGEFGKAYPFLFTDVIAGDTWSVAVDHFARLAPMVAPTMHDFDVHFHFFFVPTRLLWDDFEDWITGGREGIWREENPDAFPTFNLYNAASCCVNMSAGNEFSTDNMLGSLFDFLGVNFKTDIGGQAGLPFSSMTGSSWKLNALPVRAYWMVWNYFFRDQNVMEELEIPKTSGADNLTWLYGSTIYPKFGRKDGLFTVAWDKDYFTSSSLSPQRGPEVFVPLGATAPVTITNASANTGSVTLPAGSQSALYMDGITTTGSSTNKVASGVITTAADGFTTKLMGTADLASAAGAAVDDVRESFALQRFFERLQVTGSRFSEYLRGFFGTNAGDARLQMPEYLGSWHNPFMINNVSNTTGTSSNPQGGYAGNGMSSKYNQPIVKNFPEPGYLIGLYIALPRNGYQQGLSKMMQRIDWLDYFNPYFEHIGEQPIMSSELYFDPATPPAQDEIFGYQSQYASYKFINSHVHGNMKKTLDFWTANREFGSKPTLSEDFIIYRKSESSDRPFVVQNTDKFFVDLRIDAFADRPMTAFSTPKII